MAKSNNQKAKILYLERRLQETSWEEPVSMKEILAMLQEHEICAERKSIYDDLEVLRSMGMKISFRRERPSGYYLEKEVEIPEYTEDGLDIQEAEALKKLLGEQETEDRKKIRLHYDADVQEEVQKYFGKAAEYKEKTDGDLIAVVKVVPDARLYGWLVSMGKSVHIVKPKKQVQAYKNYLKSIVRAYKGI